MDFESTRRPIGVKWYHFDLPGGGHAGVRYHSERCWGVYFRDYRRRPIEPTPQGGDELVSSSYDDAVRRVREFVSQRRGAFVSDKIGFKLNVDQVAKVTHPDAGVRYTLALDNLTEAEARSALDHIRATGRMKD